jgi:hypothetical protein
VLILPRSSSSSRRIDGNDRVCVKVDVSQLRNDVRNDDIVETEAPDDDINDL